MTMKIITKAEVRKMTYNQRLRNYELEKDEVLSQLKSEHAKVYSEVLESLREKWMI
jgi:hypothetical protein